MSLRMKKRRNPKESLTVVWVGTVPDLLVVAIGERVFEIQLQLVVLEQHEQVHKLTWGEDAN